MSAANANPKATPAKTPNSSKKAANKHGFENNDVICGVGNFTNHGNVVLNELVEECIPVFYQKDTSREDKQMLMENIYDAIETLGGRFMDNKSKEQLTRKEALVKIKTKINNTRSKLNRLQAKAKLKAAVRVAVLATSAGAKSKKPDPEEEKPATTTPEPPKPAATEAPTKKPDPAATPAAPSASPPAAPVLQEALTVASSPPAADKNNNNKNRIQVERNRLLTGDMDEAHALGLLNKLIFATEEAKAQSSRLLLAQLNREKDQLLAWANQELRQAMVGEAVKVGLITSSSDMEAAFLDIVKAGEKGDDNQDKIQSVAHGLFYPHDKGPSPWIIAKQVEYLERQNLIYQSDDSNEKKPAISTMDYGYVYTLIASELETLGAKIAAPNDKKRVSEPSETSAEEEQPSPKKKARVQEASSKVEEEEDDSDESVPIAVLKQQKDAAMAAAAVAPKEVVAVLEDTSSSSKSDSVTKAAEPAPAPATAPTAVVVETVDEAQEEEEEVPVPTSQAMGVQVHASATQPAEKIHIVTASGIQIPTRMDKTTENEELPMDQPPQDYAPQEESAAVQEVYDEKPLNVMDPSTWTAEQKVLVAIGGICFVLLGLQLMV